MAEGNWSREHFERGRARALIDAITYLENKRSRGRRRAGIVPLNQTRTPNRNAHENSRWEESQFPCGRAGASSTVEQRLGGLSARRGRGRGLSSPHPYNVTPTCKEGKRWRSLSSHLNYAPHPLNIAPNL